MYSVRVNFGFQTEKVWNFGKQRSFLHMTERVWKSGCSFKCWKNPLMGNMALLQNSILTYSTKMLLRGYLLCLVKYSSRGQRYFFSVSRRYTIHILFLPMYLDKIQIHGIISPIHFRYIFWPDTIFIQKKIQKYV